MINTKELCRKWDGKNNKRKEIWAFKQNLYLKMYRKRPKLLQKAVNFSTVLIDLGKCVVSGNKPENMPIECIQYLKDVDALDAPSNAPATVTQQGWELTCRLRRIKIETELRVCIILFFVYFSFEQFFKIDLLTN